MSTSGILVTPGSGRSSVIKFLSLKIPIKNHIVCKAILLSFFSVISLYVFSQDYNFRNFNSEDGLAQSYVYSIIQDVNGYLWIGTGNGLSRYNGFIFENYLTTDSLANSFITCSINDGGCLWFGHYNGGLSYFDGKRYHDINLHQPNLSPVTHFAKSPDGLIWAGTYSDGLLKLSKDTGVIKHFLFKDQTIIISFDFLDDNQLLVGTNSGLLFCRLTESGKIEILNRVSGIPESKVTCIQKMRNKSGFYISTENEGIFEFTKEGNLFKVLRIISEPDYNFTGIQSLYEDSRSDLWLCSFGMGLIKMSHSSAGKLTKIKYFNKANGFPADNVKTVFEDNEGNIWSGNFGQGLTLITPKTFSVYSFYNSLYGNDIYSFYFDQKYKWIGTENGLVKMDLFTNRIVKFYGEGSGLPKDKVITIYSTDGKELWIGTGENGVFRMETDNDKIFKYPIETGVLENSITTITGKGEQIWIGTRKGLWNINSVTNNKKWYSINQGGLPHNYINNLYFDGTGRLWVSTPGSTLAYIENEKVFKIPVNSRSGNLTLGPITEDQDSRI